VDADNFLAYVSTRSPAFKTRALPKSKREAITLMLEQPNLIKRPVLVAGTRVIFGFDKDAYGKLPQRS
jgi:arsenate reductase-like glutaredoxin family protein